MTAALLVSLVSAVPAQAAGDPWAMDWLRPSTAAPVLGGMTEAFVPVADNHAPALAIVRPLLLATQEGQNAGGQALPSERPRSVTYSDAYEVRRKIHVYASLATLPLFATEIILGQKLYNNAASDVRGAHKVVAGSIATLFGVNSVTGVWNLIEARKDPSGRRRRLTHGLLMMSADAGFVATGLLAPGIHGGGDRVKHRAVALTSIGVATAAYLFMLLTK